ncbi:transposase [Nonomuraea jabiensis]|uniref:transposase n=1 Tax=Nonomuraea jabiensis TaxID=882448 RepID=UPI00369F87EA
MDAEIAELDSSQRHLVTATATAELLSLTGVGADTAAALLCAAGDNPERMRSEASFAALCGVSPVEVSSGRSSRHRLNLGGDRRANNALWWIAITRMRVDPATKDFVRRRAEAGKSKKDTIRVLKRYIAREIYRVLRRTRFPASAAPPTP